MTKWEYHWVKRQVLQGTTGPNEKSVTEGFTEDLRKLGTEGWELTSVVSLGSGGGLHAWVVFYFKRPQGKARETERIWLD